MLRRFREHIRKEKEMIAEARAEAKAEVYREVAAWDRRRRESEAQGVEFNEPPPTQENDQSKKQSFVFGLLKLFCNKKTIKNLTLPYKMCYHI